MACARCGHEREVKKSDSLKVVEHSKKKETVLVLEEEVSTLPVTRAECPECGNLEAQWWLLQTRRADEPETRFFRCVSCKHTWREYD